MTTLTIADNILPRRGNMDDRRAFDLVKKLRALGFDVMRAEWGSWFLQLLHGVFVGRRSCTF